MQETREMVPAVDQGYLGSEVNVAMTHTLKHFMIADVTATEQSSLRHANLHFFR